MATRVMSIDVRNEAVVLPPDVLFSFFECFDWDKNFRLGIFLHPTDLSGE